MQLVSELYKGKEINFLKNDLPDPIIQCFIDGVHTERGNEVINSFHENVELCRKWKFQIADQINNNIKGPLKPLKLAAVSVSFFFYPPFHGNKDLDIDNFIKLVIDGLAKGLFSQNWEEEKALESKIKFNENDSIFKNIYLEYQEYVEELKEGIYITVWALE